MEKEMMTVWSRDFKSQAQITNYSSVNINEFTCGTIMNIFNSFNDGLLARSEERERTKKKNKPKRTIKLQWPNINENSD